MLCFRVFLVIVNTYVSVVELTRALPARVVARTARDTHLSRHRGVASAYAVAFVAFHMYDSVLLQWPVTSLDRQYFLKAIVRAWFLP